MERIKGKVVKTEVVEVKYQGPRTENTVVVDYPSFESPLGPTIIPVKRTYHVFATKNGELLNLSESEVPKGLELGQDCCIKTKSIFGIETSKRAFA